MNKKDKSTKTGKAPKVKKKKAPQEKSGAKLYIFSAIKGIVFWIITFLMTVFISFKAGLARDKYYIAAIAVNALAALVSGFIFAHKKKKRGILNGFLGGLPIIVLAVGTALLIGSAAISSRTIILIVVMIISSIAGGFAAVSLRR